MLDNNQVISPQNLKLRMDANEPLFLIDVREPIEFSSWHISGSVNIPLGVLGQRLFSIPKNKELVTICAHGIRSERAHMLLYQLGYNVKTMQGGMAAWNNVYDIVKLLDKKTPSGKLIKLN